MPSPSVALDTFSTFGDLLRYLRRRTRLTQLELSIAVGYSEAQISRLEKNIRLPDLVALKALFVPALHLENEPEIVTRLIALAESARQEDAPSPGVAPYKGLLFFDEVDTDLFFGREALTARLVERVHSLAQHCPRLLAVVGASGSGKSSVVRAGLAVAMKRTGWDTRVLTPTTQPLKMLEANLACENVPLLLIIDQFEEVFTLCRNEKERAEFIEQLLAIANDPTVRISIVLALRADFYSHCAQYPQLRQAIAANQEYIGQMTREELRCAIEEPAKRGGWEFELGLVDLMLSDIGAGGTQDQEPGALPLLSHALLATWERRRGRTFTLAGYRAAGGVQRAIAETAESVFTDQLNQQQQHLARDVFLRLTELGEGTEDTRRRAGLTELVPSADQATQLRAVLNTLADARLVMLGVDSAEVAHEALIREWARLREWLNENREGLRLLRHLTEQAQSWDKLNRDTGELYRGTRLAQVLEWTKTNSDKLNILEREFLGASKELAEREAGEREAQRQRELVTAQKLAETERRRAAEQASANRNLRLRAVLLASALIVAAFLALFAFQTAQRSDDERRIAFTRELSVNAVSNLDVDPERSILLALEAVSVSSEGGKPVMREAEEALHRAVQTSRVLLTLRGHQNGLQSITVSPDGKRLATASLDGTAKVWDAASGTELLTLIGHTGSVRDIHFSPDGARLITASDDKTAKMWDASTGKQLLTFSGHTDQVWGVAISADGKRVATAGRDKTAKVWDAETGKELLTLTGHTEPLRNIAFSPDGKQLSTASEDKTAKTWDVETGKELLTLSGHTNGVWDVAYSPDGKRLATSSLDGTTKVWDATLGRLLLTLPHTNASNDFVAFNPTGTRLALSSGEGMVTIWDVSTLPTPGSVPGQVVLELQTHTGAANGLAYNQDGTRLFTSGSDLTAKVWNVSPTGVSEWLTLSGHNGRVRDVAYSKDGKYLVTAGADKTAKLWDATTGKELLTFVGHTNELRGVALSPDGKRLATISDDQTTKVWDVTTGQTLLTLSTKAEAVNQTDHSLAYSPDGKYLAVEGAGYTAKVWDTTTNQETLTLSGHTAPIRNIAFSPDGKRIATASDDKTAKLWDAASGKVLLTFTDHTDRLYGIAFSPDGTLVATACLDGTVKIWNAATGQTLLTLARHSGIVFSVAFSPDGTHLATASSDSTVKVWDISPGKDRIEEPLTLYGHSAAIYSVVYSPDGKRLATASRDGTSRVYALPLEDIIAIAQSRLTRTWTLDECQKFLHAEQCSVDPRLGNNGFPTSNR